MMNLPNIFKKEVPLPKVLIYFLFAILLFLTFTLGNVYQSVFISEHIDKINKERDLFKNRVKELTEEMEDLKKSQKELSPSQKVETPEPVIETPAEITPSFPDKWVTFKSGFLNFSFEYPAIWGKVIESLREVKSEELWLSEEKSGKIYLLSFSDKSEVEVSNLQLSSFTFPTAYAVGFSFSPKCPGECCDIYTGYSNKEAIIDISFNNFSLPKACCHFYVGTTCQPQDSKNGSIYFSLIGKQIAGVRLVIPTLSKKDLQKLSDFVNEDICAAGDVSGLCAQGYFPEAEEKQVEIEKMLKSGEGLDDESKINLQIFNRIAESARIY